MRPDVTAARRFMAGHARLLDRRRFEQLFDGGNAEPALAALRAYRNPDGGYGHGLEPDLRAPESQPAAALHAFEVLTEVGPATAGEASELCDWLDAIALPDGGLPFALPIADAAGSAPFWANADPQATVSNGRAYSLLKASRSCCREWTRPGASTSQMRLRASTADSPSLRIPVTS
jgi:hypothetical protein